MQCKRNTVSHMQRLPVSCRPNSLLVHSNMGMSHPVPLEIKTDTWHNRKHIRMKKTKTPHSVKYERYQT